MSFPYHFPYFKGFLWEWYEIGGPTSGGPWHFASSLTLLIDYPPRIHGTLIFTSTYLASKNQHSWIVPWILWVSNNPQQLPESSTKLYSRVFPKSPVIRSYSLTSHPEKNDWFQHFGIFSGQKSCVFVVRFRDWVYLGVSLMVVPPFHTPKWSIVGETQHFRKPPIWGLKVKKYLRCCPIGSIWSLVINSLARRRRLGLLMKPRVV